MSLCKSRIRMWLPVSLLFPYILQRTYCIKPGFSSLAKREKNAWAALSQLPLMVACRHLLRSWLLAGPKRTQHVPRVQAVPLDHVTWKRWQSFYVSKVMVICPWHKDIHLSLIQTSTEQCMDSAVCLCRFISVVLLEIYTLAFWVEDVWQCIRTPEVKKLCGLPVNSLQPKMPVVSGKDSGYIYSLHHSSKLRDFGAKTESELVRLCPWVFSVIL